MNKGEYVKRLLYSFGLINLVILYGFVTLGFACLTSFNTPLFTGSGNCAFCHTNLLDEKGNDVSNGSQWRSTMMANAAKDPLWQAKVSTEVKEQLGSGLEQVIQEKCSRCHMGMARYQQKVDEGTAENVFIFEDGFLSPRNYLHKAAMDGVSCTLCHQIRGDNLGTDESFTGQYVIDTITDKPSRQLYGPYESAYHRSMHAKTGFAPNSHSPDMQLQDSAHCGSCHTLYTPSFDAAGNYIEEFPEQTTYLEWEFSEFEKSCQECHMPSAEAPVKISTRPRCISAQTSFAQHHFVGGNSFMTGLLKTNGELLGITANADQLDATLKRSLDLLETKTARLTVHESKLVGKGKISFEVQVENLAGHKFPTGFPSRRAWLHVLITDSGGDTILFESGKPYPNGSIEGNDGDLGLGQFEPHYNKITDPGQVQIYEPVMFTCEGELTYTLLRANSYAKDNRLLPANFDKKSAGVDIAVYGDADADKDFIGGRDEVTYEIVVDDPNENLNVRVELLFQSLSYPFIQDLARKENKTDYVDDFMMLYSGEDNVPVIVDAVELSL